MFYKFSKGKPLLSVPNGIGDGSAYFDGLGYAKKTSGLEILPSGTNPCSFSVWFNLKQFNTYDQIFAYGRYTNNGERGLLIYKKHLYSWSYATDYEYTNTNIELNTWYHVVMVHENATEKVYLNGQLVGERSFAFNTGLDELCIGMHDNTYCLTGNIKEVQVYNRALTATEVETLYNKGKVTDGLVLDIPLTYGKDDESMFTEKNFVYDYSIVETSSGFNTLGKPIRYRSASQAGVAFSTFISQSTVFALDANKGDTELVNDLTPTYNNGTCLEDSTFKFDGDTKWATYPTQGVSNVNLGTGPFTIEWDCKIGTNHYGIYPSFICMGQSWSTAGCYIIQWQRAYSGGLSSHWNGSFDADCYPTTTFAQFNGDGLYHHIAITRDDSGLYCFWVDGKQLADTYTRTLHLDLSYTNLDFGYNRIDGGRLEYDMKHFRISNKCLYTKDFNIPKWVGA